MSWPVALLLLVDEEDAEDTASDCNCFGHVVMHVVVDAGFDVDSSVDVVVVSAVFDDDTGNTYGEEIANVVKNASRFNFVDFLLLYLLLSDSSGGGGAAAAAA